MYLALFHTLSTQLIHLGDGNRHHLRLSRASRGPFSTLRDDVTTLVHVDEMSLH